MTRPWRLTRRQRVEMEAALMALREYPQRSAEDRVRAAARALDGGVFRVVDVWWHQYDRTWHEWRVARARVALALRAALRADEDARCEGVLAAVESADDRHDPEARAWNDGAYAAIDAARAWPATVSSTRDTGVRLSLFEWAQRFGGFVPDLDTLDAEGREEWTSRRLPVMATAYALWERMPRPSLWAQSPPTSDSRIARVGGPVPRVYAYAGGAWHVSLENNHVRTTNVCSAFPMADFFDVLTTDMRHDECDETMRRAPLCGRCFNPR